MQDYQFIFEKRAKQYQEACSLFPEARNEERQALIDLLDLEDGLTFLDTPSGGGYLSEGINKDVIITCGEPVQAFLDTIPEKFSKTKIEFENFGFTDAFFDRIGSLAGLHHLESFDGFFSECYRVLKPGGKLVVADVFLDSSAGVFLNDSIDRLSSTGHKGYFFEHGKLSSLL